jgi:hypothetical protein
VHIIDRALELGNSAEFARTEVAADELPLSLFQLDARHSR